ncbi:MAG TPA: cell division ATP-binding protein FtsE [Bacillota bacterium]|nr:cell division ATP-binding protein FtsE [Bacillota bacterium]HQC35557.1 cell division ATP-binding protein FtsE [Bacillota bacterium]
MIKFENVTKIYDGDNIGLDDVTISIEEGEFVFLVGPSGAGKSTLIKLITKELNPDSGEIYVDGQRVTKLSRRQIPMLRRKIGMVFQDFQLLPNMTVFENVAFAMEVLHFTRRAINRNVPTVLTMMGIEDKRDRFPSELSAGEQQRVAIARAIVNRPKMIIADEPTGNLDPDTAWEIMQLIEMINKSNTTVLMVTHAKDIVDRMSKRVVAIDSGRIVRDSEGGEYGYDD